MTDDPREDDGFEPAPLSAADEIEVSALLASLPDPALPADVEARIADAIAGDPVTAVPPSFPHATTVVPSHAAAGPPSDRGRRPRLLQAAAAIVVLALIGAAVVGVSGVIGGSDDSGSTTAAPQVGPITASGKDYTEDDLADGVRALLDPAGASASATADAAQAQPDAATGTDSSGTLASTGDGAAATEGSTKQSLTAKQLVSPSATDLAAVSALVRTPATRDACVQTLAGEPGVVPLAIDIAAYEGRAAAVIVLPHTTNPAKVDVWVVGSTCSDKDAPFPLRYEQVPRS